MLKKAQVIMLPTKNKINGSIVKDIMNEVKLLHIKQKDFCEHEDFEAQHLYIISDDEIKEGDWFINLFNNVIVQADNWIYVSTCKKIIATTNTSLTEDKRTYISGLMDKPNILPQPSQQFIEKYIESYNRGDVITDVLVEYETNYLKWKTSELEKLEDTNKLKINSNNTITIKKLKNSWSREEVINLVYKHTEDMFKQRIELDKWIEENL